MGRSTVNVDHFFEKDPNLQKSDISLLHNWAKSQPHYPDLEDIVLLFVHFCCHYDIEATKKSLDKYLTLKSQKAGLFGAMLDKELIKETMRVSFVMELPKLTPDKNIILITKLIDFEARNFHLQNQVQLAHQIAAFHILRDGYANGVVVFADLKGASYSHILKLSVSILKDTLSMLQDTIPINIVGIHVLNSFGIAERLVNIVRFFLRNDLLNKIHFHSSIDTVYEFCPRDCLPEDYHGKLPSCAKLQEKNFENMIQRWDLLEIFDAMKIDDAKKPGNERKWFF